MAKTAGTNITLDVTELEKLSAAISEIDTQISANSGNGAAMKRSLSERIATENASDIDPIVTQVVDMVQGLSPALIAGVMSKLPDALDENFNGEVNDFLDAEVKKITEGSTNDVAALREARKAKVEAFRAFKTVLDTFGIDTASVVEPKRSAGRSASSGTPKLGKNKEGYRYFLDGKARPLSQNTISSVAFTGTVKCDTTEGAPERWGVKQLKEFLVAQGVNWGVDDEWEVKLPNGSVASARRFTDEEVAEIEAANSEAEAAEKAAESTED